MKSNIAKQSEYRNTNYGEAVVNNNHQRFPCYSIGVSVLPRLPYSLFSLTFPHSDPVKHSDSDIEATVRQLIETIILEDDKFDVRDALPNVVPDPSSLDLKSEYSCPVGKVSVLFLFLHESIC